MSHAPSRRSAAALVLWLWDRGARQDRTAAGYLPASGLVLGLAMCLRWQNGVLLRAARPRSRSARAGGATRSRGGRSRRGGRCCGAGAARGRAARRCWPGRRSTAMWLLPYPPHGADFVRLDHPFLLQTLFSSRHGLLSWTPVLWAGFLGFLPLLRRRPALAVPLLVPARAHDVREHVLRATGGPAARSRTAASTACCPILAVRPRRRARVARARWLRGGPQRGAGRPGRCRSSSGTWRWRSRSRRGSCPARRHGGLPAPGRRRGARGGGRAWAARPPGPRAGSSPGAHRRPPGQYDRLVGRYLFYRQNNLGGLVELGAPGDEAMLGEGWGPRTERDGVRRAAVPTGRARLFAPLDVPEDLDVRVRGRARDGDREVRVQRQRPRRRPLRGRSRSGASSAVHVPAPRSGGAS